jgi:hypothetical protein
MSSSNGAKAAVGAAMAAAIGLLVVPVQAQAAPADCAGYQFPGGTVSLHQPGNGATTNFETIAGGTHVDTRAMTDYPEGGDMPGTVIGDINGTKINVTVTREGQSREYPPLKFKGDVGPDDRGHGTVTWSGGNGTWDSIAPMKCIPKPAAPPPANEPEPVGPAPQQVPQEVAAPAPEEAAAPAPEEGAPAGPQGPCIPDPLDLNFPGAC